MTTQHNDHLHPTALGEHRRELKAEAEELLHEIAKRIVTYGLGRISVIHGSCATGSVSYVESDLGLMWMSDVDVLVSDILTPAEIHILTADLDNILIRFLGKSWTPGARVSVKPLGIELLGSVEAPSLLESAARHGVKAAALYQESPRKRRRLGDGITFPFALPYAYFRFFMRIGKGPAENLLALYELAKGYRRASGEEDPSWSASVPRVYTEGSLRCYLRAVFPGLKRLVRRSRWDEIHEWMTSPLGLDAPLARELARHGLAELSGVISTRWPNSLLRRRLSECVAAEA